MEIFLISDGIRNGCNGHSLQDGVELGTLTSETSSSTSTYGKPTRGLLQSWLASPLNNPQLPTASANYHPPIHVLGPQGYCLIPLTEDYLMVPIIVS